jgi:hypothetical protein
MNAAKDYERTRTMLQTYEAVLQPNGNLQFLDLPESQSRLPRRVLVTFTEDVALVDTALSGASLSESTLAQDWLREEEDAAWAHLQLAK